MEKTRIILLGNAGAGKTTMARRLIRNANIPRLSLDEIAWNEGTERKPLAASIRELKAFLRKNDQWIIEGCYSDLIEVALPECTELRFLNPGIDVCVGHCRQRPWEPEKFASPEEQQAMLATLIDWVEQYENRKDEYGLKRHRQIFDAFHGRKKEYASVSSFEKEQIMSEYKEPVSRLLEYGECSLSGEWPDYPKLGLGKEHVRELIRMVQDESLHTASSESSEVWAPTHAWRTLGQLGAEEAIEPLISIFWMSDEDEWAAEELPEVMGMIGPRAIPRLAEYLKHEINGLNARELAARSLKEIGERHPEKRDECVGILANQLSRYSKRDPELNGFIVSYLIDLKAVESMDVIEKAYGKDCVDLSIPGDFEDVEIGMGLKKKRTRERDYRLVFEKEDDVFDRLAETVKNTAKKRKIGRNEPCPCGSGKKYKKCCLGKS